MFIEDGSEYNLSEKNVQFLLLLSFGLYTPTQYALSRKIPEF